MYFFVPLTGKLPTCVGNPMNPRWCKEDTALIKLARVRKLPLGDRAATKSDGKKRWRTSWTVARSLSKRASRIARSLLLSGSDIFVYLSLCVWGGSGPSPSGGWCGHVTTARRGDPLPHAALDVFPLRLARRHRLPKVPKVVAPRACLDRDAVGSRRGHHVRRPVVELRRVRRRVPGDLLRVLEPRSTGTP